MRKDEQKGEARPATAGRAAPDASCSKFSRRERRWLLALFLFVVAALVA